MMDQFRKFGATKASKVMLTGLIVCFAAWGVGDYLSNAIGADALKVNGENVSPQAVEQTYKQRLDNITQLLGTKPTQEQIEQMQLPEQVVTEVIARTVLRQTAEKLQFQPSTQQLRKEIAMVGAFKNEKGQFDEARYRDILQKVGRTPEQFEHDLGQDIIVRQLAQLSKVEMPAQTLAALIASTESAHLTLDIATFNPATITDVPAPSASELEKFHQDNAAFYSKPEYRDIVVLRVSQEEIGKSITIPEKDILAAYEANKANYKLPEERTVRHILVKSKEEAEKIATTIKSLPDFEKAANEFTQDPGNNSKGTPAGGALGVIQEKDVVPAFAKVAFSLPAGQLSQPVQSNFGWHLIWVEKIDPAKNLALEEIREAITKDLIASQATEAVERLVGQVDEKVAAGEPLMKIAAELGLKPLQHNMVTTKDEAVEPQELETAFTLQKGETSVPITLKDGGSTYVQVTDITPAKLQPLAEVKDRVAKDWQAARTQSLLQQNANKLLGLARAPENKATLAQTAATAGLSITPETLEVTTADEAPTWLQRYLLEFYPMAVGGVLQTVVQDGNNWHVVRLASRKEVPLNAEKMPENAKIFQQRLQGDMEALLMNYLTQHARVKLNQPQLKQIFGRNIVWETAQ